jgi:hypothetical protein
MVNRSDITLEEKWPIKEQTAWRIPITNMLNMTLLRKRHSVITVSEFLRLHNISEDFERNDGHWGKETYHVNPSVFDVSGQPPSLHVIPNHLYDPEGVNRVDSIPEDMKTRGRWMFREGKPTFADTTLRHSLPDNTFVLDWNKARQILKETGFPGLDTDERLQIFLNNNGWEVLYTYKDV